MPLGHSPAIVVYGEDGLDDHPRRRPKVTEVARPVAPFRVRAEDFGLASVERGALLVRVCREWGDDPATSWPTCWSAAGYRSGQCRGRPLDRRPRPIARCCAELASEPHKRRGP